MSIRDIADHFGVKYNSVHERMEFMDIPKRNFSQAQKLTEPTKHDEETKEKLSEIREKAWQDSEYRKKMLEELEKARSKISKEELRRINKKRWEDEETAKKVLKKLNKKPSELPPPKSQILEVASGEV